MNKIYRLLGLSLLLLLNACTKKENLNLGEVDLSDPYAYDDSPLGKRLDGLHKRTGSYILYENIQPVDWTWNFDRSTGANWKANGIDDPNTNVPLALDYLENYWLRFYPDAFLKQYLPFRVILSDSLVNGSNRFQFLKGEGMQAFSIRLAPRPGANAAVTTRIQEWADSTKKRVARDLLEQQYLETVGNKLALELPDSFFLWSSYDYSVSISATPKNPKELGFWNLVLSNDKLQNVSPSRGQDVTDWLKTIAATKPENMQALFYYSLSGVNTLSEPMVRKYNLLQTYLQNKYGMNFHDLNALYY